MILQKTGYRALTWFASWLLFLRFLGHLSVSVLHAFSKDVRIPWFNTLDTLYNSGARLFLPLVFTSGLAGLSLALTMHYLLTPYGMQDKALVMAITLMYRDLVPLLIGVVLCVQSSLSLVAVQAHKLRNLPQKVIFDYLFPIVIGINLTGMMLYTYMIAACLFSIFLTFNYVLHYDIVNFLMRLSTFIGPKDLVLSIFKTAVYCTLVSLAVGYYYYEVAIRDILLRKAVSRIITRGLIWIMLSTAYLKLFTI